MRYRILIGINVRLAKGEAWRRKVGQVDADLHEVRFEPGDVTDAFPKHTAVDELLNLGAVELVEEDLDLDEEHPDYRSRK